MNGRLGAGLFILVLASCRMGPRYAPAPPAPAGAQVRVGKQGDSTRLFFDSLAAARRRDPATVPATVPISDRPLGYDSLAGVAWMEIMRDTTLVRLVTTAVRQNRTVQAAAARINEYRALVGVARAPLFPSLTVNASESSSQVALGAFPPVAFHATRATADMAWEVDFWGRIRNGVTAARADLTAQEAAERAAVLSLVSDVATGYLQLLELDEEQAIAERTLASRQQTLGLARQRFQQGVISELDVRQFEAQVAAPAVTLAQAWRLRAQTEHNLNVLLGEAPSAIARTGSLVATVEALVVPDSLPATLLARRPDVQQAERAYAAASARIGVVAASVLPTVTITGSYGSQASKPADMFAPNTKVYGLAAGVSVPIFAGGRQSGESAAARARAEQARAQYELSALNALRDANDALVGVRSARDQAVAQATQVVALRSAARLAQVRYEGGVSSYVEVLDAQRSLFAAELALSQSQLLQLTAAVQLYKALGGSWTASR
ncbi:MAG TPA: efflux transporter outer membrane subunit [Gemmatimonadaceae bacterium]|nr:efflux transporter outer membrane subunit [Gemmatimonadaceae bacterium]